MLMHTEPSTSDSGKATAPEQPTPEQPTPERVGAAPGPEELDLMLRVTPSIAWPILMTLVAAVTVALVWSVVSHASQRAEGTGILLTPLGVADIPAPAEGRVEALKVKPGQRVKAGELVALLSQEDLAARLRQKQSDLEEIREQESLLRAFHQADAEQRSRMIGTQEENLKVRIRVLEELEKA